MKNYFDIKDKVAVVTGASSGLGWQIAQAYASQGAKVALFARREERLQENVAEIEKEFGTDVMYAVCDVGDYDSITAAVAKVMDNWGRIDILVNAAGMGNNKMVTDQSNEEWERHIHIDLSGVYYMCKAVGEIMIEQEYGKIINIGSIHSRVIFPGGGISAYSSAKGGVMNLTKNLAVEWAKYNITVNAICPGTFPTELTRETIDNDEYKAYTKTVVPVGRSGVDGELDSTVVYLASPKSSYVTGQAIAVDGGYTCI